MCGRYYRQSDKQKIAETFHVARWAPDVHLAPDYNIAPSTFQPINRSSPEDGEREIVLMRWGLIPARPAAAATDCRRRAWIIRGHCTSSQTRCKAEGWLQTRVQVR